jgi:hypothetical protein
MALSKDAALPLSLGWPHMEDDGFYSSDLLVW